MGFTPADLLLGPIYLLILYFIAFIMRSKYPKGSLERKYFILALSLKFFGVLCFISVYQFYYKGGDTFTYYKEGSIIWEALKTDPAVALKLFMADPKGKVDADIVLHTWTLDFFRSIQTFTVVRIVFLLALLCFDSYLIISFFFAFISFLGLWAMYRTFTDIYPELKKELAIAILFMPSVIFWGSGILKDTVTIGCLGFLVNSFYYIFVKGQRVIASIIISLITAYLIFSIKPYILFALLPGLLFWIIVIYRSRIRSTFFKFLVTPVVIGFSLAINYFVIEQLAKEEQKFSFEKFVNTASAMQGWHGYLGSQKVYGGGSNYSIGNYSPGVGGVLKVAPASINVTLFRPYLWEARNIVMVVAAIESTVLLWFTLSTIWKVGFRRILQTAYSNPEVFFCLIFSLIFAFAVGFSSYNFGALVRYKIPCIPLYVVALFIIRHVHQKSVAKNNLKPVLKFAS